MQDKTAAEAHGHERGPRSAASTPSARRWMLAVAETSYVAMPDVAIEAFLADLLRRLAVATRADPFSPLPGIEVGAALVEAHFTDPRTLSRTLDVLLELAPVQDPSDEQRWRRLVGAVAEGYAAALQERALKEQEEMLQAALTAREQVEDALQVSERRFQAVFEEARVGIGIGDLDGHILDVNPTLVEMLGYSLEEFRQHRVHDFMHPEDVAQVWRLYGELVAGERDHFRVEKQFLRADGQSVWTHLTVSLLCDGEGKPAFQLALIHDVTELHELQTRLEYEAHHDALTGLPNRKLFLEHLDEIFAAADAGARVGLLFLDLDGFKAVNDTLGHDIGDELLVTVSERIRILASAGRHTVARLGGDEFVVLARSASSREEVTQLAQRLLDTVGSPVRLGDVQVTISASIGIVERAVADGGAADLLRAADVTLYWAKSDGKSRWAFFEPERNARDVRRYTLSTAMPAAIAEERFLVHYQPLITLADGRLHGVEALVRWQHPEHGLIRPDLFVGLAEESGLIVPLGRWVLQTACRQARAWFGARADGPFISVNLAAQQLGNAELLADVHQVLKDTGLYPAQLQLEITESAVVGNDSTTWSTLESLFQMGVRIAIDDFGTGYSNLAHLRHLPAHELKLAGSFLRGFRFVETRDPVDENIVASLVSLAHLLGLTVTAEGVESEEQVRRLVAMGCDAGQGTYFSPAAAADEIGPLLRDLPHAPTLRTTHSSAPPAPSPHAGRHRPRGRTAR